MDAAWIVLGLLAAYLAAVAWLVSSGRLAKWNLGLLLGVILMVRTQRGKRLIDWVARPRRLWNAVGDLGIALTLAGMAGMTLLFLWSVGYALQPDSGVQPLGVSEILVIPGFNPFVPLWYGLAALIITLVVHEGGHGVLARANAMRVKSLGLLVAVVPIGAFVEPDEEDLRAAPRRKRLRVFAAGPTVNLALAALSLACFASLAGAATLAPGAHIATVVADGPADHAGVPAASTVVEANGTAVADWAALRGVLDGARPGDPLPLRLSDGTRKDVRLSSLWDARTDGQREAILRYDEAAREHCRASLQWEPPSGGACAEALQAKAFLGVRPLVGDEFDGLAHPLSGGGLAFLQLVSLPIGEVRGSPVLSTYLPAFTVPPFEPAVYWVLLNLSFWVFWINLMVGLTNILPMVPLDGGHIFRDAVGGLLERLRPRLDPGARERIVRWTAGAMSLLILGAFVLQIAGPYVVRSFG